MQIEKQIIEKVKLAQSIVITSHKSPDGDSIGSSLALFFFLKKLKLDVSICHPDQSPKYLQWVNGSQEILNFEEHQTIVTEKLAKADLIFSLDYNDPSRLGDEMAPLLNASSAFKIMVDHHLFPSDYTDIALTDTNACSTCQLIYQIIVESDNKNQLDLDIATPLYLGIMTDTGSFRFNSVKPVTHRIIADLLEVGVKQDYVHEQIYDVNTPQKLKLRGYATSEKLVILSKLKTAYISLSKDELARFDHEKGDTEGLVNVALSVEGVKIAAFFSEKDGEIKISFRSKGNDHPINELARKYFSGGGHANASGGIFSGKLEDAIQLFVKILPDYVS